MRSFLLLCILIAVLAVPPQAPGWSDETVIVMHSGERFKSSQVWEEEGVIRFNMQGLLVRVNKGEVAAIIPAEGPHQGRSGQQDPSDGTWAAEPPSERPENPVAPAAPQPDPLRFREAPGRIAQPAGNPANSRTIEGIGLERLVWGMPREGLRELEKVQTDPAFGGIDQYRRPDQPLVFGDAPLDGFVYGFWHNQLYSIMMWADGRIGYERLRRTVVGRFGPGRRSNPDVERHVWADGGTQRMLEFDSQRNTAIFILRSSELHDQIRQRYPD